VGDVAALLAVKGDLETLERRIRILSPEKAQLLVRLGRGEVPAVAKRLGLTRVLVFEYAEKVSFDSSRADLKSDAFSVLDKQAEILNQYFPAASVYVCGYTDSTGGDELNDKLSWIARWPSPITSPLAASTARASGPAVSGRSSRSRPTRRPTGEPGTGGPRSSSRSSPAGLFSREDERGDHGRRDAEHDDPERPGDRETSRPNASFSHAIFRPTKTRTTPRPYFRR